MDHILVPTNLLDYAENAAEYAVQLAAHYNARVTLFHTYHIPVVDPLVPAEYLSELAQNAEKNAQREVKGKMERLKEKFADLDVTMDCHCTMGFAADEILAMAEKLGVDTILMGTRHKDTLQRILVGSVLGTVLEESKVPVIIIPNDVVYRPVGNVMFASEYNDSEDIRSINRALEFVEKLDAKLYSVHVQEQEPDENDLARLDGIREVFKGDVASGKLHFENIYEEDVIHALTEYSHHNDIDMLMMVTHKRSFFERIFDRSISKQMAFRADIPLVVFHQ